METPTFLETLENNFNEMRFSLFIEHITAYYEALDRESFLKIIEPKFIKNDTQRFIAGLCMLLATTSPLSVEEFRFMLNKVEEHYGTTERHGEFKEAVQFISSYHKVPGKNYGVFTGG